jgi:acyl-[acyl-carrier-protein]-phospholipid O-acyltransferase/long-chain-fatty-acid--[acyl-carrier-protein] ligase
MKHDKRSFRALVGAQFLGAFNDNLFKQLLLFLAAGYIFKDRDVQGMAAAVFALPFVLFSGMAGDLSERFSKRTIVFQMKIFEIGVMLLGVLAFMSLNWTFLLAVLFLMGTHSAFFGPSKYGVIPEIVPSDNLLRANGVISMTTFAAILLGQALAGPLLDSFGDRLYLPAAACVLTAVAGTLVASRMSQTAPQNPTQPVTPNPFGHIFSTIKRLREHKGLMRFVLLYSLFWFNGSVIQQAIVGLGAPSYLDIGIGEKRLLSFVLVTLSLSIIIGSLLTPFISKRVGIGRTVIGGTVLMVLGQVSFLSVGSLVSRTAGGLYLCHFLVAIIGMGGAMFVVPIQTYLQYAPEKGRKGQTVGVNNFMNFLFMFLGGLYYLVARLPSVDLGPTMTQALSGAAMLFAVILNRRWISHMEIQEASA